MAPAMSLTNPVAKPPRAEPEQQKGEKNKDAGFMSWNVHKAFAACW